MAVVDDDVPVVVADRVAMLAAARRNTLLAALPWSQDLLGVLEVVRLKNLDVAQELGRPAEAVLFPVDCVLSVATRDGDEVLDVTTVGREGLVGLPSLLGADVHDTRAICRVPGEALRLPVAMARQLLVADVEGLAVLHAYVRGNVADLIQRIACNRAHSNEQRCACWLLKTSDRVGDDAFELTHATLATMLGVRRATVTDSLAVLQRHGVLRSRRGVVSVLDRSRLEAAACGCYGGFRRALPLTSVD